MTERPPRPLPLGATVQDGATHFRVWAPLRTRVEVALSLEGGAAPRVAHALRAEGDGYFATVVPGVRPGARYGYRLDDDPKLYPDPASRSQPEGPHGLSQVIDPRAFAWSDQGWKGCALEGQILYEMHVGTFTPEGTWAAAQEKLATLADLGVTVIEMMPIADFAGTFGWGYDGVNLFAPTRLYGTPDDLRRFVDAAHALGLGVILDVVYNHFGPDGAYLAQFSADYRSATHVTDWGAGLNYDGPRSAPVREFVVSNAGYWIDEFHFDGLRLDATQDIKDASSEHVIAAIARHARAGTPRPIVVVAENEPQEAHLARPPSRGGYGVDALWNDDFHHSAHVALTGRREAYYQDYAGAAQELVSAIKWGYLFQGQRYAWQKHRRGTPSLDLSPAQFVLFLENHDQVANTLRGHRLHQDSSLARWRTLVATYLLAPGTPMLFQGEEFRSSSPFLFFADHQGELGAQVEKGRREFLAQFPSLATADAQRAIPNPNRRETFDACKLDWSERDTHAPCVAMYRDLLALRKGDPVFCRQARRGLDGAVLTPSAFVLRFFSESHGDRLLLVNLGPEARLDAPAEPLLAPPTSAGWTTRWSSEDPRYGGAGAPRVDTEGAFTLLPESAVVLQPLSGGAP
jgi:maltooligosyltrehalose trehalohydrolase